MRPARIGKQARLSKECVQANQLLAIRAKRKAKADLMTLAILFAFTSALFLGLGVVTTQFGLRDVEPLAGASISVPSFTLLFLVLSPLILQGEPVVLSGLPMFAGIGLVFPALLTLLTFASNRALGPVITSTLG